MDEPILMASMLPRTVGCYIVRQGQIDNDQVYQALKRLPLLKLETRIDPIISENQILATNFLSSDLDIQMNLKFQRV